jgi:CHAT domain-containing protein
MALRARAGIKAIGHLPGAAADIREAVRLSQNDNDPLTLALQANFEEAKGQTLLEIDPKAATEAFTQALALSSGTDYRTFRTRLFAQRATALRRSGRPEEAKNDLRAALDELRSEEAGVMKNRPAKVDDELWSAYFARFQETYRLLIRQLVEEHRWEEAFHYAENARGYEPLNLVIARHTAPRSFNGISNAGEPASLAQVQQELPRGTFLFEYCVLDDRTYTWIISHDGLDVVTQPVPRERIRRWSAQLQRAVKRPDITAFDTVLFAQYDGLLAAPLAAAMKMSGGRPPQRLVIIPDDAMHGLPLAASSRNSQPRTYLIEEMPVEIDGSATLYLLSLARDAALATSGEPTALLIGDPAFNEYSPRARGLQRLEGARSEVERLRKLYGPRATMLVDRQATIPEFLRLAKGSSFIQLAAHGVVDAAAPSRSALLLAPSPGDDGVLDAQTLLKDLKLDRTRLVVLSACSSAGGLPVGPEGVAPLVRPLIAAGAPAVIGSLWAVNDATAAELFVSFHQHYRKGSDAAVALQKAQIEMLKKKLTWASFQVIGHASSPFAPAASIKKEKPP